ncbi:hypothetical protein [Bacillus pseudomycoides]|uniref:hypothetical protein n=1 Tax=Bacillus pseudomycoides TaxID=64104 RepID=UPI000BF64146|nr:hypothetical protein [Bacillus pseudomycoides]PGA76446.1 hypothetical protein COL87_01085 [Bacillus pseudomycoides]PGC41195.1 hypothetical protein COM18_11715 [Bacillus pseudomycoides]PHE92381.1 hypothetical protein COF78_17470 [Bacillus pseudomycoides]
MDSIEFLAKHEKLRNMCFQLERLQMLRNAYQEQQSIFSGASPYDQKIDDLLFDIMDLLFKELNVTNNISELRDIHKSLDQVFAEVLFGDGDVIDIFEELDELRIVSF